ncbi:MAG: UDP-N-acetylmuramoyl-L-alanyl-D-glutamate--2,6-diaminopimelate ligase [Sphingomonadales bacterium]|nr:UDP-N-acetylmuramoyl-L-alanyl-D-glutamate--2,6-diaminopimelate ligase [Sphingomonadales bacterium]
MTFSLQHIINRLKPIKVIGQGDVVINGVCIDSRKAGKGFFYAAMPGTHADGHDFIDKAIDNGATAILANKIDKAREGVTYILVDDVAESMGIACHMFYGEPTQTLKLVGTTGTNGKTTVSTLMFELFTGMGYRCGLVSTVENRIGTEIIPSTHTTPDAAGLNALLAQMVEADCDYCFMECSSHAIHQRRIAGLEFTGAVFTNLSHDHLDYHKTFDNYLKAKKQFFDDLPATAWALTNKDDRNGMIMLQNTKAARYTYAMKSGADFTVKILESDFQGMQLKLDGKEAWVNLVGAFNAYNLAAVYGAAFLLTSGEEDIILPLTKAGRVNGRFEAINGPDRITAIVDYAHTPDALENVIKTINDIRGNHAQLITVVGCGGNRDTTKRPEMGKIAARLSSKVIFTSDNPRDEDPDAIIQEMEAGVEGQYYKKLLKITDRKEAIRTATILAAPGDVILIAGKGHETYQEIKGVKHPFDDKAIVKSIFNQNNT